MEVIVNNVFIQQWIGEINMVHIPHGILHSHEKDKIMFFAAA